MGGEGRGGEEWVWYGNFDRRKMLVVVYEGLTMSKPNGGASGSVSSVNLSQEFFPGTLEQRKKDALPSK